MKIEYENKEECAKCGGYCCKKCGCDYSAKDFESLKIDFLQSKLEEGYISIVSYQDFKRTKEGKLINQPFLYLRARNINRPIVDLLSMKTTCKALQENGCLFDALNRPSGGLNLIPGKGNKIVGSELQIGDILCYPEISPFEIVHTWKNYQNILFKLVKKITGKSVYEQIKIDVENLFCDIMCGNVDGVMKQELYDIKSMLPLLKEAYPLEYEKAYKCYNKNNILVLSK